MKKILLIVLAHILSAIKVLSQSVWMHEAQQDAEESGEFSFSGFVLLLIIIGIIWVINACIKDAKERKEHEKQRPLKEKSNRQTARNRAINLLNANRSISKYIDNGEWREGFIEATYDILFGKPKQMVEDMATLNQEINSIRTSWNSDYYSSYHRQRFNDTIKKIGYLSRLEFDAFIEKQKEEEKKKQLEANLEREKEEQEKNKIIEKDGCLLQNRGTILTKVVGAGDICIPEGVEIIKEDAFKESKNITNVKLPSSLKTIDKFAFAYCKSHFLEIPRGVEKIEENAFFYADFEKIVFCNSMEYLPIGIFSTCRELKYIELPFGLKAIPPSAFKDCLVLKNISIPETVKIIGDDAFSGCQSLMELQLPESLEELGRQCFKQCYGLKHIEIPSNIVGLPKMCLYDCSRLKKVILHDGLCCIMSDVFENSSNLEIKIPSTVSLIQESAFCHCNDLHLIVPRGRKEEFESKCNCCYDLEITEYDIDSDKQIDIDKEKKIDKFIQLQKAKDEQDLFEFTQEMASQGVFFKTGNSTIDSLFDDSFLFDMDDEY